MGDDTVVQRVIEALAEAEGIDPLDAGRLVLLDSRAQSHVVRLDLDPPLYEAVETDALEALAGHDGEWYLQFTVDSHVVAVHGDDGVTVEVT